MPIECEKQNVGNDFYVKTFHIDRYWSATPEEERQEYDWMKRSNDHKSNNDNMWCNNPDETAAFMEKVEKPWVAFKVMAGGSDQSADRVPLCLQEWGPISSLPACSTSRSKPT